jgi:hypothetical protein
MFLCARASEEGHGHTGWTPSGGRCKLLTHLNGEMSEWLNALAWKAILASITKRWKQLLS